MICILGTHVSAATALKGQPGRSKYAINVPRSIRLLVPNCLRISRRLLAALGIQASHMP